MIVDDDADIRKILKVYLTGEGYNIIEAKDGFEAIDQLSEDIDLIILDIMMPGINGISTCSKIREQYYMPILFLTAKAEDMDKISGLTVGADDYMTKPFNPMELVARVKSHLRRSKVYHQEQVKKPSTDRIDIQDLHIDLLGYTVKKNNQYIKLTKTEFNILKLLATHRGQVFSLEQIYRQVWGEDCILNAENTVSVHIKKLREKIEENIKSPNYIKTIWGVGYRID